MRSIFGIAALVAFAATGNVSAQQVSGTLTATAIVAGSVGLRVTSPSTVEGSTAVAVNFARSSRTFTMPIDVEVHPANVTACILIARLQSAPAAGTTWTIDDQQVTDSIPAIFVVSGKGTSSLSLHLTVTAAVAHAKDVANAVVFSVQAQ